MRAQLLPLRVLPGILEIDTDLHLTTDEMPTNTEHDPLDAVTIQPDDLTHAGDSSRHRRLRRLLEIAIRTRHHKDDCHASQPT